LHSRSRNTHTSNLLPPFRLSSILPLVGLALALSLTAPAAPAFAGAASLGQPLFYPCTSCHPVTLGADGRPTKPLPNGFTGHVIALESHDKLGQGNAACLVCHDDPSRDPGKLKLIDGSLVDITGDVSRVCYRCHEQKYKDWQAGTHGKHEAKCTAAGCHDPHTPAYVFASAVLPFSASGFQVRAVSDRKAFTPLASAPLPPPVKTPSWLLIATTIGMTVSAGLVGSMILRRPKR
jgi:hypothetical protein